MIIKINYTLSAFAAILLLGCSSVKTADDFISDYCKCIKSATNDEYRKKCEPEMLAQMAEQMKSMQSDGANRAKGSAIIFEVSQKLTEARKKCGDSIGR